MLKNNFKINFKTLANSHEVIDVTFLLTSLEKKMNKLLFEIQTF